MKKLNVAVVGVGMGSGHISAYLHDPRVNLAAICDINKERLRQAGEKFKVETLFEDAQKMLRQVELDAISIATPK